MDNDLFDDVHCSDRSAYNDNTTKLFSWLNSLDKSGTIDRLVIALENGSPFVLLNVALPEKNVIGLSVYGNPKNVEPSNVRNALVEIGISKKQAWKMRGYVRLAEWNQL
jgi:hypothetical protein